MYSAVLHVLKVRNHAQKNLGEVPTNVDKLNIYFSATVTTIIIYLLAGGLSGSATRRGARTSLARLFRTGIGNQEDDWLLQYRHAAETTRKYQLFQCSFRVAGSLLHIALPFSFLER